MEKELTGCADSCRRSQTNEQVAELLAFHRARAGSASVALSHVTQEYAKVKLLPGKHFGRVVSVRTQLARGVTGAITNSGA